MNPLVCDAPTLAHFDYEELEDPATQCGCQLCKSYRETYEVYENYRQMCHGHSRSCTCFLCTQKIETHLSHMAALSQRDTYSELSYLTHGKEQGPRFLRWVYEKMMDSSFRSEAWWAIRAPCRSLAEWMIEWQIRYLPREVWEVSGVY